jgi:hypothetical protein
MTESARQFTVREHALRVTNRLVVLMFLAASLSSGHDGAPDMFQGPRFQGPEIAAT